MTRRAKDWLAIQLGITWDDLLLADTFVRYLRHVTHARDRAQIIWPQHVNDGVSKFRELILHLFAQTRGKKCKTFQKTLNVRIGRTAMKKTRKLRVNFGKFFPLLF